MKQYGFTLIELLVVMSIIAILTTIGLVAYKSIQESARDTERREEILQIAAAIEAHKDNTTNEYVFTTGTTTDTDLAKEFPQSVSGTTLIGPAAGLDPLGNNYCIVTVTTVESLTPPTSVDDTNCTALQATSGGSAVGTGNNLATAGTSTEPLNNSTSSAKGWVLCAQLETTTTPFCKVSSTGAP